MSYRISIDSPSLFITAVAKDRLPAFQTDKIKELTCKAIDEARTSCGFLLFAYVIMPDHIHLLTDSPSKPSVVLQYIKGIIGHRVIDYLKAQNYESSLRKLRHANWKRNHRFSLWQHDSDIFSVTSESKFMEKVNYISSESSSRWVRQQFRLLFRLRRPAPSNRRAERNRAADIAIGFAQ